MQKTQSLRRALSAALPELKRDPDRLKVWIENGAGQSRETATLSFGFRYRLNVLCVDMSTDIAVLALALFRWLRVNQVDLLAPGTDGFAFDVDVLDNGLSDILFQLDLTENVSVGPREDGGYDLAYLAEPDPMFADELPPAGLPETPLLAEVRTDARPAPLPDD
ncbi:phage tail protein [Pelagerythrobacter sp.]|uniref:phage tail protein n=1 Tax=Pelagerythrobacter sp. TaxID=2800702 RepID=UPI0035B1F103